MIYRKHLVFTVEFLFFILFIYFIPLKYQSIDLLPFNDANGDSEFLKAHYRTRSTLEQKSLQPETMTKAANQDLTPRANKKDAFYVIYYDRVYMSIGRLTSTQSMSTAYIRYAALSRKLGARYRKLLNSKEYHFCHCPFQKKYFMIYDFALENCFLFITNN